MTVSGSPGTGADTTPATTRRRENTRARLLEAAEDVFVRKGLNRVTVDDLVGAAGFTRGAFYSNFSSLEEVFVDAGAPPVVRTPAVGVPEIRSAAAGG